VPEALSLTFSFSFFFVFGTLSSGGVIGVGVEDMTVVQQVSGNGISSAVILCFFIEIENFGTRQCGTAAYTCTYDDYYKFGTAESKSGSAFCNKRLKFAVLSSRYVGSVHRVSSEEHFSWVLDEITKFYCGVM
jgi:hypothetical protein